MLTDKTNIVRHFNFKSTGVVTGETPRKTAKNFLTAQADVLKIPAVALQVLDEPPKSSPIEKEKESLCFGSEHKLMGSTIISYAQTIYGLPIYGAGISIRTHGEDNAVRAATSTLHYDPVVQPPGPVAKTGDHAKLVREAIPDVPDLEVKHVRLMVYRNAASERLVRQTKRKGKIVLQSHPTLSLPPVHASIVDETHYVVVEALFSAVVKGWGKVNWRAFIEPETKSVLFLRALAARCRGRVLDRDPITTTGNPDMMPRTDGEKLDKIAVFVPLVNLDKSANGTTRSLSGEYVKVVDIDGPGATPPTAVAPFDFSYPPRTDDFAAVNAYYHCDRFFRLVHDLGFDVLDYFDGTTFPVRVDHRGDVIDATCYGDKNLSKGDKFGIEAVKFDLADDDRTHPLGMACDWRIVLHELAGHGTLLERVDSPFFHFAHSAGDSVAAILNDPDTKVPKRMRGRTFPWQPFLRPKRRHDRKAKTWGWGGRHDDMGYESEQILSTCHFRLYRSIGGDSKELDRRDFAARATVYLILKAIGQLKPETSPRTATDWETQLEDADVEEWYSKNPAKTHAGGAYHKVIRWAFEKQGLFRATGAPDTAEGDPPDVDVYIDDDGRDGPPGEYQFQKDHWSCTDIWNRLNPGLSTEHQEPRAGQINHAYVRIKNRGTQRATKIVVKGFHCRPGIGLGSALKAEEIVYPTHLMPMTTAQLPADDLGPSDNTGVVVGPFQWTPSQVGDECMFFCVSADHLTDPTKNDRCNIETMTGASIPAWRLVPNDNNIGQRMVNARPASA